MTHAEEPTISDVLHAISRLDEKVERVHAEVKRTNGRVTTLEEKDNARVTREAVADALSRVGGQVVLTRKGLTGIVTAMGLIFTAANIAIGALR